VKKLLVVYTGGQYVTVGDYDIVDSTGTSRAIKRLVNKTKDEYKTVGDNFAGWIYPNVLIYDISIVGFDKNDITWKNSEVSSYSYPKYTGKGALIEDTAR